MKAKDPLHELIHSLSPSEKRYFKRYAQLHGTTSGQQYLDLFAILEKLPEFDDKVIRKRLKNKTFAKNLSAGKYYLYNLLLRSLQNYHANHRGLFQLYGMIQEIYLLYEKNLLEQAEKRLQKAKKEAQKYQYDLVLLELLSLESKANRTFRHKKSDQALQAVEQETEFFLRQLNTRLEITKLYDRVFFIFRNHAPDPGAREEVEKLVGAFSKNITEFDLSFESSMLYHLIWANYYLVLTDEPHQAAIHLKSILDLFETTPELTGEYPERYINVVNNYLSIFALKKDFSEFPKYLARLEKIDQRNDYLKLKLFQVVSYLKLTRYMGMAQYREVLTKLPSVEKGLEQYGDKVPKMFQLEFRQIFALAFFYTGAYDEALTQLNFVIHEEKHEVRQDIQVFSRVLQLLLHYELENWEFARSLAQSIYRFSGKNREEQWFVREVSGCIQKAIDAKPKEALVLFRELKTGLENHAGYLNGREAVIYWLERQLKEPY